ncbi:MAG: hypothetical protein VKJ66_03730 [Synechococcus sp.]|nr:hypothetical protein [Synechococcus sp.]
MVGSPRRFRHAARWLAGAAPLLLLAPVAAEPAAVDLNGAVSAATAQLRQAWAADPTSAALPFPSVRLLPAGESVDGRCSPKAPPRRPAPTAAYCAASGEVLLDRDLLADAAGGLQPPRGGAPVAYWIATALAERLLPAAATGWAPTALATLQANCLAGVLLGAAPARRASPEATPLLMAARGAYGDRYRAAVGTAGQRGYALLSGLGATATPSCAAADMETLLRGAVPDPALLAQIDQLSPSERGHGSLIAAINSQCRPLPNRPCPRRISPAR